MITTSIEWTERTWNPTVGCSKVSPGCDHCYAIRVASREMQPAHVGLTANGDWTGEVRLLPERLHLPLKVKKPAKWFVDSMSDLFHPEVPDEFIQGVLAVMTTAKQHTFQILTKRPQRMADVLQRTSWDCNGDVSVGRFTANELGLDGSEFYDVATQLPNVWWGTSIENDTYAFRARHLQATPGRVKFLSLEPLLGPLPSLDLTGIDWVIVGGESGPGARPMHPSWVRSIRDRCIDAKVPFHFKQWGEWIEDVSIDRDGDRHVHVPRDTSDRTRLAMHPAGMIAMTKDNPFNPWKVGHPNWTAMRHVGKKAAGRELDGHTWDEFPS